MLSLRVFARLVGSWGVIANVVLWDITVQGMITNINVILENTSMLKDGMDALHVNMENITHPMAGPAA
jgi:hypothetical protein